MKKIISFFMAFLLLSAACAAEPAGDFYVGAALNLTEKIGILANDEGFCKMYINTELAPIEELKTLDFTAPTAIYRVDIVNAEMILKLIAGEGLSEPALDKMLKSLPTVIVTLFNSRGSTEGIAASSILNYGYSCLAPEGFEPCIYVVELDGGTVAVSFANSGDGIITISATPLFLSGTSLEEAFGGIAGELPIDMEIFKVTKVY